MRIKIIFTILVSVLAVFLFVSSVISLPPQAAPVVVQNCTQLTCEGFSSPVCTCGEVNESDDIYANNGDTGIISVGGTSAILVTDLNDTEMPENITIITINLVMEWYVTGISTQTCKIEIWNGTWEEISANCRDNTEGEGVDIFNIKSILHNITLIENATARINYTQSGTSKRLKVDHIYINITYLPQHVFDTWNLFNATGSVISNGENFTRSDIVNASANWTADGILNATIEHDGTGVFVNYTLNESGGFPGNYTTHIMNLSNTTEFPLAGNITVNKMYATDLYGQLNSTSGIRYFSLYGFADVSGFSSSSSTILNGSNATLLCNVTDSNSTSGIPGFNVSFFKNNTLIGSNTTNASGISSFLYSDDTLIQNDTSQTIEFKCNITDQLEIYYNVSVAEQTSNLSIVDVNIINLSGNHTLYNLGENLTLSVIDTSNNTITNITWIVNLTKFNESEQNLYNQTNDTFTFNINTTDPLGNYTLFANTTVQGRSLNQTWRFNVSDVLNPQFTQPASGAAFSASTPITPILVANNVRNERLNYTVNVTLTCPNGVFKLVFEDSNYKLNTTDSCLAPSSTGAFSLTANTSDTLNNSGNVTLSLSVPVPDTGSPGGGGPGGGPPAPTCECEEWTSNNICGFGSCSGNEVQQTRVCNPVDLCSNETTQRCVESPACFGVSNFNFSVSPTSLEIIQGESKLSIVNAENSGDVPIQINTSIETELDVSGEKNFELIANESVEFSLNIHAPLTLKTGEYLVTINLSSGFLEKTKTITVQVLENTIIGRIDQLETQIIALEQNIEAYKESGVNVADLELEANSARQALQQAKASLQNDQLEELKAQITSAEAKINSANAKLLGKGVEKFFAENIWYIILSAVLIVVIAYLLTEVIIPYYSLGKDIKSLSAKEKELIKTRIETEKQYFRREIDEKTFRTILIEGQGKILRVRGSLKTKKEFRSALIKTRLSPKGMLNWFKKIIPKLKHRPKYHFKKKHQK